MKRIFTKIIGTIIIGCLMTVNVYCTEIEEYKDNIYSSFSQEGQYGVTPDNLGEITTDVIFDYVGGLISQSLKAPLKIIATIVVFAIISRIVEIIANDKSYYQDIVLIICFVSVSSYVLKSFESVTDAMESVEGFLVSYVPIYASVIATSGNAMAATSYSSILLFASQGAVLVVSVLIKPLLSCMLVVTVLHSLNPDMPDIVSAVRRICITATGLIMSIYLGVIGLQGIVGRAQDSLTVRASKYLVSSFVPIIGGSLNESYRTVSASLSSIRAVIGTFGVVIILIIFSMPIVSSVIHRWTFTLCEFICGLLSGGKLSSLAKGLSEVYLLLSAVVTIYMLMLIIATGALVSLGGTAI